MGIIIGCMVWEVETGYVDGWYDALSPTKGMAEEWDRMRPQFTHLLFTRAFHPDEVIPDIPDWLYLPNIYHEENRMKEPIQ